MQFLRRSDRLTIAVPIRFSGIDTSGNQFTENTRTLVISRYGAKIALHRLLSLDQTFVLGCLGTNRQAPARVVGKLAESPDGFLYGVEILDPEVNLWEINFPSPMDSELAAGRVLLECNTCHDCEVAYLDKHELEIFNAQRCVSRVCPRCNDATTWIKPLLRKLLGDPSPALPVPQVEPAETATGAPVRIADERRDVRIDVRVKACVETLRRGGEIVLTQNVSEGGLCFESASQYNEGDQVDIAIPYVPGGANVFVLGRIAWRKEIPGAERSAYGLEYMQQRRRARRVKATIPVGVAILAPGIRATGEIADISVFGMLMKCRREVEVGIAVRMGIDMGHETIRLAAVAKRKVPGVGTAFEFSRMGQRDRALLRRLIFKLENLARA